MIDIFSSLDRDRRPPRRWAHQVWPPAERPSYPHSRRTTVFHEAGHIIFCYLLNVRMLGARVDVDNNGKVDLDIATIKSNVAKRPDVELPRAMEEKVTLDLATMYVSGAIAECTLYGIVVDGVLIRDCSDWRTARQLLRNAFGNDHPLFYCQELARFVLLKYWPLVTRLAIELDSKGAISAERVKEICAGAPPDPVCIS